VEENRRLQQLFLKFPIMKAILAVVFLVLIIGCVVNSQAQTDENGQQTEYNPNSPDPLKKCCEY
jgi:preprotein translocase subunit SecG